MEWVLTIKQPYVNLIFEGKKTLEVRKKIPKEIKGGDKVFVCVKGNGSKICASFVVADIVCVSVFRMNEYYSDFTCLKYDDLIKYAKGKIRESVFITENRTIYGIGISDLVKLSPIPVTNCGLRVAPQGIVKVKCPLP